jgi:hypothetical protein
LIIQDFPIWKDVKNRKSYLRKRSYNVQEPVPPKPKPTRSGDIGREIPFILGTVCIFIKYLILQSIFLNNVVICFINFTQGSGKSHSVTVNLQKAFALLKNHNPNSCSVCNKKNTSMIDKNKSKKRKCIKLFI